MTVEIKIGNSLYKIACAKKEEERLKNLAKHLNHRMNELKKSLKITDEKILLVMTALALEENLRSETEDKFDSNEMINLISDNIDNISDYIEKLTNKIQKF
ncbi:MAG: cell division protein ZapA [Proteobacteria bacterium]|nr:cell division protein ZapA [Pseudomonadota bacterium]